MAWLSVVSSNAPLITFLSVLTGALGIPVPVAAALVLAGSLLANGHGGVALAGGTLAAGMAGAAVGDVVWFVVGRKLGAAALGLICRLSMSRDTCVRRTAEFFYKWGLSTLLFARFVPGLSIVSAPMAGASGFGFGRYMLFAMTGDALAIGVGLGIGYFLADQFRMALQMLEHYGIELGAAVAAVVVAWIAFKAFRQQQLRRKLSMARINVEELTALMKGGTQPIIIDVRASWQQDKEASVIPGSLVIDLAKLPKAFSQLDKKRTIVVYCSCPREISAAVGARKLLELGFTDVRPLLGGLAAWRESGGLLELLARPGAAAAAYPPDGLRVELV